MFNLAQRIARRTQRLLRKPVTALRQRNFRPYVKRKNVEGVAFDFFVGDLEGQQWYDLQSTDPVWVEMRFLRDHLIQPGDVVFEAGAHHGCTTILLSRWVGDQGKVFAFEPHPGNGEIIRRNILLNKLSNVVLHGKAVGAGKGTILMNAKSNSSVQASNPRGGVSVEMTFLDKYADLKPNFLKIDVEGYEAEVLKGAKKILATRPKLAMEIHTESLPGYGTSVQELLDLIPLQGYRVWIQWEDGEEPAAYATNQPITSRVHLFAVPE